MRLHPEFNFSWKVLLKWILLDFAKSEVKCNEGYIHAKRLDDIMRMFLKLTSQKKYLVKWSTKGEGNKNVQKTVHMVYEWPLTMFSHFCSKCFFLDEKILSSINAVPHKKIHWKNFLDLVTFMHSGMPQNQFHNKILFSCYLGWIAHYSSNWVW